VSVQSDNPAPTYAERPIGIDATGTRTEFDSLGTVEVPADRYWGAQTQRSLQYFSIALASGKVTVEQFDSIVKPTNMVGDGIAGA
jgi:fumarate hydratase class II